MKTSEVSKQGTLLLILGSLIGAMIPQVIMAIIDQNDFLFIPSKYSLVVLILFFSMQVLLLSAGNYQYAKLGESKIYEVRIKLIDVLLKSQLNFHDKSGPSALVNRLIQDVQVYKDFIAKSIPSFISGIITIVISISFLFAIDWYLTVITLVCLPIIAIVIIPISTISNKLGKKVHEAFSALAERLNLVFSNIKQVKSYSSQDFILNELEDDFLEIRKDVLKSDLAQSFITPFLMLVLFGVIALIFIVGALRVNNIIITTGALISFLIYIFQLLPPVSSLSHYFTSKEKAKGTLETVLSYLDNEVENHSDGNTKVNDQSIFSDTIEFNGVGFAYDEHQILDNLSFTINKGEKMAIVGPSGTGKSTIFNLLSSFYDSYQGSITIDGSEVKDMYVDVLRDNVLFVSQKNSMFSSSLVGFFEIDDKEKYDFDKLLYYLDKFNLTSELNINADIIIDTNFGSGGNNISEGQKQRLILIKSLL